MDRSEHDAPAPDSDDEATPNDADDAIDPASAGGEVAGAVPVHVGDGDDDHADDDDAGVTFERAAPATTTVLRAALASTCTQPCRPTTQWRRTVATWVGVPLLSAGLAAVAAFAAVTLTLPYTIDRHAESEVRAREQGGRCTTPGFTATRFQQQAHGECASARRSEQRLLAAGARTAQVDVHLAETGNLTGPADVARVSARVTYDRPEEVDQDALRAALAVISGTSPDQVQLVVERAPSR